VLTRVTSPAPGYQNGLSAALELRVHEAHYLLCGSTPPPPWSPRELSAPILALALAAGPMARYPGSESVCSNAASVSEWWVPGNMSTSWSARSRNPEAVSAAASRASAPASQAA
jgi:hypothetical protein